MDFKPIFDLLFGNEWILTGSEAVKMYLQHFNRLDLLTFEPRDIDIIYVSKSMIYKETINGFKRKQSQPEKSMTFEKGDQSFDVTTQDTAAYYEIDGYKLILPEVMLENYEDNLEFRDNPDDPKKIEALKEIIKLIKDAKDAGLEKKRLPVKEEEKPKAGMKRRGLFSHFDKEDDKNDNEEKKDEDEDEDKGLPKPPKLSRSLF